MIKYGINCVMCRLYFLHGCLGSAILLKVRFTLGCRALLRTGREWYHVELVG